MRSPGRRRLREIMILARCGTARSRIELFEQPALVAKLVDHAPLAARGPPPVISSAIRRRGEGRRPTWQGLGWLRKWIPACAGMTPGDESGQQFAGNEAAAAAVIERHLNNYRRGVRAADSRMHRRSERRRDPDGRLHRRG